MTNRQYFGICKQAKSYTFSLNRADVDWRDMAHEAVVKALRGKKYSEGAMKDAARRLPLFGQCGANYTHRYKVVPLLRQCAVFSQNKENIVMSRLERIIRTLPEAWQFVLYKRYWGELTFVEISQLLGVSEARSVQLHTKALDRIRERLRSAERTLSQINKIK